MTQTTNLQDTVNNTLQEILNTKSILLWTNQTPKNSFILKKDGKRYLGLLRKDKKGGDYWKFKEIREKKSSPDKSLVVDNITKYQQRLEKTQAINHANNSNASKE